MNGSYTPQTVPLGGKALAERLQPQTPAQTQPDTVPWTNTELRCCLELHTVEGEGARIVFHFGYFSCTQSSEIRRRLSSELAVLAAGVQALTSGSVTPCSVDTGYSDQRLDTPTSSMAGSSVSSQGGGGTPYSSRSGTPFSQESGYTGGRL